MTTYDRTITNGTCYYQANEEAHEIYSPAGNAAVEHTFCCQLGDKINSENVCVNAGSPVYTYIAGCTDPDYQHPSCPYKGNYSDYQWVALTHCNDENDQGLVTWVGCDNDRSPTLERTDLSNSCTCDLTAEDPDEELIKAGPGLDAWGTLPDRKGEQILWLPGYTPTPSLTVVSATGADSNTPATTTGTLPSPTTRESTTRSSSTASSGTARSSTPMSTTTTINAAATSGVAASGLSSFSTGEKAGLGIGIAVAAVIIVGAIIFLGRKYHKKRKQRQQNAVGGFDSEKPPRLTEPTLPNVGEPDPYPPAYTGGKPELPGSHAAAEIAKPSRPYSSSGNTELPGSPAAAEIATPSRPYSSGGNTMVNSPSWPASSNPSPVRSSEQPVYRPFRYQPDTNLEGIQELPDHQRPRWAQTDYGIYGPDRGYNTEHHRLQEGISSRPGTGPAGGKDNVHELPG